jgi:hypothetical protein
MQFSITIPFIFTLAIFASAAPLTISERQDELMQCVADEANLLNEDIVHTTQFFEAFPTLSGLALTTQASAAVTALQDAASIMGVIAGQLSNNAMAQVIKAELLDNDFLLDISLQFDDLAQGADLDIPFYETLGLYCSDAIPEINTLFQIIGSFVNDGINIVALLPNNCPN